MSLRRLAVLCLLLVLATACEIRTWLDIDMGTIDEGSLVVTFGLDEDFRHGAELAGSGALFPDSADLATRGWELAGFVDGDVEGVTLTRGFSGVDELNRILAESTGATGEGGLAEHILITDTASTIRFEASVPDAGAGVDAGELAEAFAAITFDARISVTFPGQVLEHNGQLRGQTVTWVYYDEDLGAVEMFAEARKGGAIDWALVAGLGLTLGLVGLAAWWAASLRRPPAPRS